jgi:arylsulfatase A-like enzyme
MSKQFKGTINIDVRDSVSDWEPYEQPKAPAGAPNVLFIVWGKPVLGRCRPSVAPSRRRQWIGWQMAACATRSSTPQRCAPPTSASLLTGRNHTTVGTACICEAATGFPGSNGHIPFETATIAEVLSEEGYNTYMLGKWHCCPEDETNMASTKRNWPTGRGFEQFYGFLGGETNQ